MAPSHAGACRQLPSLARQSFANRIHRVASPHRAFSASAARRFNTTSKNSITVADLNSIRDYRERVVILGSGWGGYTVARELDPKKFQAVVISPRSYFAFTPLLASTAVGTLEFRTAVEPIRSKRTNVSFVQGWADGVDFRNKTVTIEEAVACPKQGLSWADDRDAPLDPKSKEPTRNKGDLINLKYDRLVIAVGCYSQTFGTPGVKEHALFLKDVGDARKIRQRLLTCFEMASLPTTTEQTKRMLLNFAIVGGGPTGIEFAAELHDIVNEDLARIYPDLKDFYNITVYDVAPKVLPMFDENLSKYAMEKFRRETITIKTSHHVEELRQGAPRTQAAQDKSAQDAPEDRLLQDLDRHVKDEHLVYTLKVKEEGEIGIGMCVWSTGLMMNPFVDNALGKPQHMPSRRLKLPDDPSDDRAADSWRVKKAPKIGSIVTDEHLRVLLEKEDSSDEAPLRDVYAIGDCATVEDRQWPATAQVANQKAVWLAKKLNKGEVDKDKFTYKNLGVMAYIGNWNAILQTGGKSGISGRTAWLIWRGAYLTKSVSWRNKILIPIYWCINWLFGRDITRF